METCKHVCLFITVCNRKHKKQENENRALFTNANLILAVYNEIQWMYSNNKWHPDAGKWRQPSGRPEHLQKLQCLVLFACFIIYSRGSKSGGGTVPLQGWTDGLNTVFPLYIAIVLSLSTSQIFFIIIIITILRAFRYTGYLGQSFFSIFNMLANAVNVYEETDKKHGGVKWIADNNIAKEGFIFNSRSRFCGRLFNAIRSSRSSPTPDTEKMRWLNVSFLHYKPSDFRFFPIRV